MYPGFETSHLSSYLGHTELGICVSEDELCVIQKMGFIKYVIAALDLQLKEYRSSVQYLQNDSGPITEPCGPPNVKLGHDTFTHLKNVKLSGNYNIL